MPLNNTTFLLFWYHNVWCWFCRYTMMSRLMCDSQLQLKRYFHSFQIKCFEIIALFVPYVMAPGHWIVYFRRFIIGCISFACMTAWNLQPIYITSHWGISKMLCLYCSHLLLLLVTLHCLQFPLGACQISFVVHSHFETSVLFYLLLVDFWSVF